MLAASWIGIVRLLLAARVGVNAVDEEGATALIYAILKQSWTQAEGNLEAMRAMIAEGADVNHRDLRGITPMGHARGVLTQVELEEEVIRAFNPDADLTRGREWDDRRLAEAVVKLVASAGGRE